MKSDTVMRYEHIVSSYRGKSLGELASAFEFAGRTPCVLFFDEADSLVSARISGGRDSAAEDNRSVNRMLVALDELRGDSMVIFATNIPDAIDPSLMRRIAISLDIPAPGDDERRQMVALMLRAWPMAVGWEARAMQAESLAEIEQLALAAARQAVLSGEETREVA